MHKRKKKLDLHAGFYARPMKRGSEDLVRQPTKSITFHPYHPAPAKKNATPPESSTALLGKPNWFEQPGPNIKKRRHASQNNKAINTLGARPYGSHDSIKLSDQVPRQSPAAVIEGSQQANTLVQPQTTQYNCGYSNSVRHPHNDPNNILGYPTHNHTNCSGDGFIHAMDNTLHERTFASSTVGGPFGDCGIISGHSRPPQSKQLLDLGIEMQMHHDRIIQKMNHQERVIQQLMSMIQKLATNQGLSTSAGQENPTKLPNSVNDLYSPDTLCGSSIPHPNILHIHQTEDFLDPNEQYTIRETITHHHPQTDPFLDLTEDTIPYQNTYPLSQEKPPSDLNEPDNKSRPGRPCKASSDSDIDSFFDLLDTFVGDNSSAFANGIPQASDSCI